MIDEKTLIKEIESLRVYVTGIRAGKGVLNEYAKHLKDSVIRIINDQPKTDRWIPCTERMPEEKVPVLVTYLGFFDNKPHSDGMAYVKDGRWHWHDYFPEDDDTEVFVKITAWQALLEPYRGDEK